MNEGEKFLETLLKSMKPELNLGEFVFCSVDDLKDFETSEIIGFFKEKEAITIIVPQKWRIIGV